MRHVAWCFHKHKKKTEADVIKSHHNLVCCVWVWIKLNKCDLPSIEHWMCCCSRVRMAGKSDVSRTHENYSYTTKRSKIKQCKAHTHTILLHDVFPLDCHKRQSNSFCLGYILYSRTGVYSTRALFNIDSTDAYLPDDSTDDTRWSLTPNVVYPTADRPSHRHSL